jgi:peptide/nickel transport system permease protein
MLQYILRRIALMIPVLLVVSIISFVVIQLPPGDYLTSHIAVLAESGDIVDQDEIEALKKRYGLDRPMIVQYFKWIWRIISRGDFGQSFRWNKPVKELIGQRLSLTITVTAITLVFQWMVALPIGIYSATHQYSLVDHVVTTIGFIGLAVPNFLLALILIYLAVVYLGTNVAGLFSPEYVDAPWSVAKVLDMLKHMWVPVIIVGTSGTAGLIRVMRANLLDELNKPYVVTGRAKGLAEQRLLYKYPVRVAINPFVSTIGWTLPTLISGITITAIILSLPTAGPLFLRALQGQDMYLAGSFVLILSTLTVIGTLVSDILLAWVDPRIRFGGGGQ